MSGGPVPETDQLSTIHASTDEITVTWAGAQLASRAPKDSTLGRALLWDDERIGDSGVEGRKRASVGGCELDQVAVCCLRRQPDPARKSGNAVIVGDEFKRPFRRGLYLRQPAARAADVER